VGTQVVTEVARSTMAPFSYQAAINMLQELVVNTGHGDCNAQSTAHFPTHEAQNGYMRPLPYPHFMPATNAQFHPYHPQAHPSQYIPTNVYSRPSSQY